MASETTFDHWKVVFSWGKMRKSRFSQKPLTSRFWAFGFSIYTSLSANFKKDPPRNIFCLSVHAPATCDISSFSCYMFLWYMSIVRTLNERRLQVENKKQVCHVLGLCKWVFPTKVVIPKTYLFTLSFPTQYTTPKTKWAANSGSHPSRQLLCAANESSTLNYWPQAPRGLTNIKYEWSSTSLKEVNVLN